jgi:hypothetical protein
MDGSCLCCESRGLVFVPKGYSFFALSGMEKHLTPPNPGCLYVFLTGQKIKTRSENNSIR